MKLSFSDSSLVSKFLLGVLLSGIFFLSSCEKKPGNQSNENPDSSAVSTTGNTLTPPKISKILTYRTTPENPQGILIESQQFDATGQLYSDMDYALTGGQAINTTHFTRNNKGFVTQAQETDASGKISLIQYTYTPEGHTATSQMTGTIKDGTLRYGRNKKGDLVKEDFFNNKGELVSTKTMIYSYDSLGQIIEKKTSSKTAGSEVETLVSLMKFSYDKEGNMVREELYNGKNQLIEYDLMTYDAAGNEIIREEYAKGKLIGKMVSTYNEKGAPLSMISYGTGKAPLNTSTFAYDEWGNEISATYSNNAGEKYGERKEITYAD